jgi:N-acetylglucosaminyl-diphospho-decaprenol L-rhamnosyltransferase
MDGVIVTHNSAADLRELTASGSTLEAFERIIVVDNASTDETREIASAAGLELIPLEDNRGMAAAGNVGAAASRGDVFVFMNPDVRLADPADLERLEAHLGDLRVGAVAPALVLPSGELQDSARWVPTPFDLVLRRLSGDPRGAVRGDAPVDVEWAVAAFLVIRRSAFDAIGGFDEGYFLYFEDVELGVQLRRQGFSVRFDPTVRVLHDHRAASRSSIRSPATRHHIRSALRFYGRHPASVLPRRRSSADSVRGGDLR